jgi:hypothetical protein
MVEMKFWKNIFDGDFFSAQGYKYGYGLDAYGRQNMDEFIGLYLSAEAATAASDLGQSVVREQAAVEAVREEAALVVIPNEQLAPQDQRMHALELRPRVMNAWRAAHQAERLTDQPDRFAVAQGIVELFPRINEHLESPNASEHLSLTQLLQQAEIQGATLEAITNTYVTANQEQY